MSGDEFTQTAEILNSDISHLKLSHTVAYSINESLHEP